MSNAIVVVRDGGTAWPHPEVGWGTHTKPDRSTNMPSSSA